MGMMYTVDSKYCEQRLSWDSFEFEDHSNYGQLFYDESPASIQKVVVLIHYNCSMELCVLY